MQVKDQSFTVNKKESFNFSASLVSAQNRVEAPFIMVRIGQVTLGGATKKQNGNSIKMTYPNFVKELRVVKTNGQINQYTLTLEYAIQAGDDPNLLDKIFSSVTNTRKIYFTYGDWQIPSYIYKEEEAIITKVTTRVDFGGAKMTYTVTATSNALALQATNNNYPAVYAKPSDIIKQLLQSTSSGLTSIFTGMRDIAVVKSKNLIASDDKRVQITAKNNVSVLEYISYLVNCMRCVSDNEDSVIKDNVYYWYVCDDVNNDFGGPYFKVVKVSSHATVVSDINTYEVDVGYPTANYVSSFNVQSDDSWAILYNYSKSAKMPEYTYKINDDGKLESSYSPNLTNSNKYYITTEADRTWWTKMTQFPVKASLTIKGLLRPAMLMQHVKINSYFFGRKHVSSGLYVITKQEDVIGDSGYKTELSLLRIAADDENEVIN